MNQKEHGRRRFFYKYDNEDMLQTSKNNSIETNLKTVRPSTVTNSPKLSQEKNQAISLEKSAKKQGGPLNITETMTSAAEFSGSNLGYFINKRRTIQQPLSTDDNTNTILQSEYLKIMDSNAAEAISERRRRLFSQHGRVFLAHDALPSGIDRQRIQGQDIDMLHSPNERVSTVQSGGSTDFTPLQQIGILDKKCNSKGHSKANLSQLNNRKEGNQRMRIIKKKMQSMPGKLTISSPKVYNTNFASPSG